MIKKFNKFTKLSSAEKQLFIEAFVVLGIMRAAILTVSFKRLTRSLKHHEAFFCAREMDDKTLERAVIIGRSIERAAAHTPWESACLAKALSARYMLQRRGIAGCFYLGVRKNGMSEAEPMNAHAWSVCGKTVLTGKAGHEDFIPLSTFEWGGK